MMSMNSKTSPATMSTHINARFAKNQGHIQRVLLLDHFDLRVAEDYIIM